MKQVATLSADVSRETRQRLECYVALLLKWNATINLISARDASMVWERHVADSLGFVRHIPTNVPAAIDLGSGGGLPGLVLAIATDIRFDLVEADQRKCAFLREAARATLAPVTVHAHRIETVSLSPSALVTARALAPLPLLLRWASKFLASGGIGLFAKGRGVEAEITAARASWTMQIERLPSATDPQGCVLRVSEIRPVLAP